MPVTYFLVDVGLGQAGYVGYPVGNDVGQPGGGEGKQVEWGEWKRDCEALGDGAAARDLVAAGVVAGAAAGSLAGITDGVGEGVGVGLPVSVSVCVRVGDGD